MLSQLPLTTSAEATWIRRIFLAGAILVAGLTVLTHLFQLTGGTFAIYSVLATIWILPTLVAVFLVERADESETAPANVSAVVVLLAVSMAGAAVELLIHRPSGDDYSYLPN